jgi:hypothetical protein
MPSSSTADESAHWSAEWGCGRWEVDSHLYRLSPPLAAKPLTWKENQAAASILPCRLHPYALEALLIFHNVGRTRFRLYNARVAVNALPQLDQRRSDQFFSAEDAHLRLTRIMTSRNSDHDKWKHCDERRDCRQPSESATC